MKTQYRALIAELIKNKRSRIVWVTFIAFAIAPLMGGVFMVIMQHPEMLAKAGLLNAKIEMMNFKADWESYLMVLQQAMGIGGILIFGFVASWVFGREYADGTAKDLLALPTSRTRILNAKFIVYVLWCLGLAVSNLIIGFIIGAITGISGFDNNELIYHLQEYLITTLLTILLGPPIALMAIWGKGYLAPLGFVALTLVFAQIIAATGFGAHFPWSVPGLYSGAGGEYKEQLDLWSFTILIMMSIAGYVATVVYWEVADQEG